MRRHEAGGAWTARRPPPSHAPTAPIGPAPQRAPRRWAAIPTPAPFPSLLREPLRVAKVVEQRGVFDEYIAGEPATHCHDRGEVLARPCILEPGPHGLRAEPCERALAGRVALELLQQCPRSQLVEVLHLLRIWHGPATLLIADEVGLQHPTKIR